MKKFFPYILILTLTVGFLAPVFVYGQTAPTDNESVPLRILEGAAKAVGGGVGYAVLGAMQSYFGTAVAEVATSILKLMAWLLYFCGMTLNFVLNYTIVNMKANIAGMVGINIAWKVIRDLMNMAFIFMLVYEGILIILSQKSVSDIRKFITGIVLASILINFSLFFTKVLIDASNVVTTGFYNSAVGPECAQKPGCGLSDPIMQTLGLTSIYSTSNVQNFVKDGGDTIPAILLSLGGGLVILIASFIFLAMSVLFIVRYIVLLILLMLSPIGYMGMALPFMQDYQRDWWKALKSQLLFGPIYMIMMWVIIKISKSPGFIPGVDRGFDKILITGSSGRPEFQSFEVVFVFAVIIGLLIASMIIAKNTSTKGASLIGDLTKRISTTAGGAIMGSAATVGRNTFGRAGNALANSDYLKEKEAKGGFFARNLAAGVRTTGMSASKSTFDARTGASKILGKEMGGDFFGKGANAKDVNFVKDKENKEKKIAERVEGLKTSADATEKAKAKLNDAEFLRWEEERRKDYFDAHPDALSETKDKEKELIQNRDKTNNEKSVAQKMVDDKTKLVISSDQEITKLKKALQEQIKIEEQRPGSNTQNVIETRKKVEEAEAKKKDLEKQLENEKSVLKQKVDAYNKAESDITANQKKEQEIRNSWMSEERKKTIAQAGGTTEEQIKGGITVIKDATGKEIGRKDKDGNVTGSEAIKSAYENRVEAVISRHEAQGGYNTPKGTGGGTMARWTKNILRTTVGMAPGVAPLTGGQIPMPVTARDNRDIVRAIRKKTKQKSEEEEAMEAMKKLAKKQADDEKKKNKESETDNDEEDKDAGNKEGGEGAPA